MLLWNLHWLVWSGNQPLLGNVGKASRPASFWKGLDLPNAWNAVFQLRSNKIKIEKGSFPYIILFGPVGDVGASWHHTEKKTRTSPDPGICPRYHSKEICSIEFDREHPALPLLQKDLSGDRWWKNCFVLLSGVSGWWGVRQASSWVTILGAVIKKDLASESGSTPVGNSLNAVRNMHILLDQVYQY